MLGKKRQRRFDSKLARLYANLQKRSTVYTTERARDDSREILDAVAGPSQPALPKPLAPVFRLFSSIRDRTTLPSTIRQDCLAIHHAGGPYKSENEILADIMADAAAKQQVERRRSDAIARGESTFTAILLNPMPQEAKDTGFKHLLVILARCGDPHFGRYQRESVFEELKQFHRLLLSDVHFPDDILVPSEWEAVWRECGAAVVLFKGLPSESDDTHSCSWELFPVVRELMRLICNSTSPEAKRENRESLSLALDDYLYVRPNVKLRRRLKKSPRGTTTKTVEKNDKTRRTTGELMNRLLAKHPEALGWTAKAIATRIKRAASSVVATAVWKGLQIQHLKTKAEHRRDRTRRASTVNRRDG